MGCRVNVKQSHAAGSDASGAPDQRAASMPEQRVRSIPIVAHLFVFYLQASSRIGSPPPKSIPLASSTSSRGLGASPAGSKGQAPLQRARPFEGACRPNPRASPVIHGPVPPLEAYASPRFFCSAPAISAGALCTCSSRRPLGQPSELGGGVCRSAPTLAYRRVGVRFF